MEGSILARRDCLTLDNGMRLRLLSALEVLQARREAEEKYSSEVTAALVQAILLVKKEPRH